jgi:hypothetical protein
LFLPSISGLIVKSRCLALLLFSVVALGACSAKPQSFETWVRSDKALKRMSELKGSLKLEDAALADLVGDGTSLPLVALERRFRAIPNAEVLSSARNEGNTTRAFLKVLLKGQNVKTDESNQSARLLWLVQLFRVLPPSEQAELCKRASFQGYTDSEVPCALRSFEEARNSKTEASFKNELFDSAGRRFLKSDLQFDYGLRGVVG